MAVKARSRTLVSGALFLTPQWLGGDPCRQGGLVARKQLHSELSTTQRAARSQHHQRRAPSRKFAVSHSAIMFSPEASIQSARSSLRNTRRRQRTSEGLAQQPRRKRSKLSDESFVAKDDVHVNGNGSALMNGHAGHSSVENSLVVVDMPVREKKAPQKRAPKEDNSLYLVSHRQNPSRTCALTRVSTDQKCQLQPQETTRFPHGAPATIQYAAPQPNLIICS
jgi:hypothetical protein